MTLVLQQKVSGVLFDLDGTLVNTLKDLGNAMNTSLVAQDLATHDPEDYKKMIGGGMHRLVELASGGLGDQEQLLNGLLAAYGRRIVGDTRAYSGIHELLRWLRRSGKKTGVVSNKAHGMTVDVVARIFPEAAFKVVVGHRPPTPKKPDPTVLIEACNSIGVEPGECLFIGDTDVDMKAGRRAGLTPVGVGWGYQNEERLLNAGAARVVQSGNELIELIGYMSGADTS